MAKRVYYGTCKSESGEEQKKVYVPDIEIIDNKFNFEEGDLLTVFFAQKNDVDTPSIVIYNQDPEQESSTTIDGGKYIKTLDVEAGLADAWDAGETVIFVYTQQDTSDSYYWELVDAAHATTTIYGNTKLFTITDDNDFKEWITNDNISGPDDVAMTPYMLKRFYKLLKTVQDDQQEEEDILLGLKWTPADYGSLETQPLGTLSFGIDGSAVTIDYPIQQIIQQYITNNPLITHTGQLYNNGNGTVDNPIDPTTEPFITRMVPNNLYFNNGNGLYYSYTTPDTIISWDGQEIENPFGGQTISVPRIILNDQNNNIMIGGSNDNNLAGIWLGKPTYINGNASIYGNLATSGSITANNNSEILTGGNLRGGTIYEGGISLINKYSRILKVEIKNSPDFTIAKGSHIKGDLGVNESEWKPLGLIGYNITNSDSGGQNASFCLPFSMMLYDYIGNTYSPHVRYEIRNINSNNAAKVYVQFRILYVKR